VIELGRLLKEMNLSHNVLLLAFSGEEKGLWGSNYFTKNPSLSLDKMAFMVNMDMIGRLSENKKLAVHGVGTSPVFEEVLVRNNQDLELKIEKSGSGPSDHSSFYYSDVPVLSFFTGQHEDYHKPSDDEHLINYEGMADVLELILRVIVDLDDEEAIPFQKTKDESQDVPSFKVTLGVMPDYMYSGEGMRIDGVREGKTADVAGIKKGDVVVKMGDIDVVDMMTYMKALSAFEKGQETDVELIREGEKIRTTVVFQ
jgi:C-terminal processing protease CtpA/Prc